ncbi:MAG: electron transport complex subunit E [Clostridia bacterium]|nr:electron transport complex subunit E [Clostridia bacterium]
MKGFLKQLKEGILDNNPVLVQLLGMCPTLATTTLVENAFGMGLAATAVLICSNLFISLLRKFIPSQVRIAAYIVIISGFVTAVELLMRAYFYSLYQALGLFIPLIVVNCIILARAEAYASKNKPLPSVIDGVAMGLGFTFALVLIASVREILGSGTWLGFQVLPDAYPKMTFFVLPAGAFITLGFIIAAVQKIRNGAAERARLRELASLRAEFLAQKNEKAEEKEEMTV